MKSKESKYNVGVESEISRESQYHHKSERRHHNFIYYSNHLALYDLQKYFFSLHSNKSRKNWKMTIHEHFIVIKKSIVQLFKKRFKRTLYTFFFLNRRKIISWTFVTLLHSLLSYYCSCGSKVLSNSLLNNKNVNEFKTIIWFTQLFFLFFSS